MKPSLGAGPTTRAGEIRPLALLEGWAVELCVERAGQGRDEERRMKVSAELLIKFVFSSLL